MKRTALGLATVLALFVTEIQMATPADACGLHLIVKAPAPRQAVARSSRPSNILLLGSPSHHLQRDLAARGHNIEVSTSTATAKLPTYAAVMTDASHLAEARTKYGANKVFIYKDFASDAQVIEGAVARAPSAAKTSRVVVLAQHHGTIVAAGGGKTVKDAGGTQDQADTGNNAAITDRAKRLDETRSPKVVPPSKLDSELFFGLGSATISRRTSISSAVTWLQADQGRSIVIEGYADASGSAEANMKLSQQRADAVKDAMVSEGIDSSRIEIEAYGATKLKYGRADSRNRRVRIHGK